MLRIGNEAVEFLPEHLLKEAAEPPAPSAPSNPRYSETVTKSLTDLGFTMEQVVQALDAAQGNPDLAADLLCQQ